MRRKPPKTRVVGYRIEAAFDEPAVERVLAEALRSGAVTQYDTGRGHLVWFNGPPGAAIRSVRDRVRALVDGYEE